MKIGIVTTWFERGAAYVSKQFEDCLSVEHNVFIYARGGEKYAKDDLKWDNDNVTWAKKVVSPFTSTIIDKKDFKKWLKYNEIEAVIFNEQRWWYPILWCNEMGIKTIAYVDYYTEETLPLFSVYDILICNTKKHFKAFEWHLGARYVAWGTDLDKFIPNSTVIEEESNIVKLFHSCGMNPLRKGTDLLLKCLEKLQNQNYQLTIHSQVSLTDYFPELAPIINGYLANGKLKIIQKTVTAPGLYFLGDVYIYPSRLDGIGLTVAEAVSSGMCIVVPDCGPMNEFVSDEFSKKIKVDKYYSRSDGYYWPQNEVSLIDLAKGIDYFLDNEDKIERWKICARNFATKNLNWKKNANYLLEVVEDLSSKANIKIESSTIQLINNYEKSGVRKLNNLSIKFSWFYKLYKKNLRA